jgi:hypothetical protein
VIRASISLRAPWSWLFAEHASSGTDDAQNMLAMEPVFRLVQQEPRRHRARLRDGTMRRVPMPPEASGRTRTRMMRAWHRDHHEALYWPLPRLFKQAGPLSESACCPDRRHLITRGWCAQRWRRSWCPSRWGAVRGRHRGCGPAWLRRPPSGTPLRARSDRPDRTCHE